MRGLREQGVDAAAGVELADLPLHKLLALSRRVRRDDCASEVRVAVVGDAATQHYCGALGAVLRLRGAWSELYESEFDTIRQELLDSESALYRHEPDSTILFTTTQALAARFASAKDKAGFIEDIVQDVTGFWRVARQHSRATLVQHNFVVPLERPFGNQTVMHPEAFAAAVNRINTRLIELAAAEGVRIIDTEVTGRLPRQAPLARRTTVVPGASGAVPILSAPR